MSKTKQTIFFHQLSYLLTFWLCISSSTVYAGCDPMPQIGNGEFLASLKGVNLYVYASPQNYQFAVNCFGVMNACATKEVDAETLDRLQTDYKAYPPPLQNDKVAKIFESKINDVYSKFVIPDVSCNRPKVNILKKENRIASANAQGFLTFTVRIEIADYTKPRIAVLTFEQFRPEVQRPYAPDSYSDNLRVIPLDLPDAEIAQKVEEFANQAIKEPMTIVGTP